MRKREERKWQNEENKGWDFKDFEGSEKMEWERETMLKQIKNWEEGTGDIHVENGNTSQERQVTA